MGGFCQCVMFPLWRLGLLEDMSNHLIRKPTSHDRAEGCHLRPAVIEKQWVFFQTFGNGPFVHS